MTRSSINPWYTFVAKSKIVKTNSPHGIVYIELIKQPSDDEHNTHPDNYRIHYQLVTPIGLQYSNATGCGCTDYKPKCVAKLLVHHSNVSIFKSISVAYIMMHDSRSNTSWVVY